jgi:hypothetical protein
MSILVASLLHCLLAQPAGGPAWEQYCVNPALAIPDGSGVVSVDLDLGPPRGEIITDLSLVLEITHAWTGDLVVTLIPSVPAVPIQVLSRVGQSGTTFPGPYGCGGNLIDVTLWDGALAGADDHCICAAGCPTLPTLMGEALPDSPLAPLLGLSAEGQFQVQVQDVVAGDSGTLQEVCLQITTAPDCNGNGIDDALDLASGSSLDLDGNGVPDECGCVDEPGFELDLGADPNPVARNEDLTLTLCGGEAGQPAQLFLLAVNGVPLVRSLLLSSVGPVGILPLTLLVPDDPTLPGLDVTLQFFSLTTQGAIVASNPVSVAFQ